MDSKEIVKRHGQQVSERKTVEELWNAIERYVTPYRGRFFKEEKSEHSVEWQRQEVFDSTAIQSHQTLAASIHGSLSSPSTRWFDLQYRNKEIRKDREAMAWLENAMQRVYFELQDSNFNLEVNETYQDLCGFGTSFLILEAVDDSPGADWSGLNFISIPLKEGYFEQDHKGQVMRFYRALEWTPGQIISKFGRTGIPQNILDMDEAGSDQKLDVIMGIYKREGVKAPKDKVVPKLRPYGYKYVLKTTGEMLGDEGGYYEMPVFVPRWRKTSSSKWGNSPASIAMADILTLNRMVEMILKAAEKAIDPPIMVNQRSIMGDLDLNSATLNIVRDVNGIKTMGSEGRFDVATMQLNDYRERIRNYFFVDQLNFPTPQAQPMTATEAQIRYEQMQKLLGPTLGRLQNDLLNPTIQRAFNMLVRENQLGEPPESVVLSGGEIDILYLGPLARAQRIDQVASIERFVSTAGAIAQLNPDVLDVVDFDAVIQEVGDSLSIPPAMIRDKATIKRERAARADNQARANEAALAEQEGNANKALGEGEQAIAAGEEV